MENFIESDKDRMRIIIEMNVTIIIRRFLHRIYTSRKMMIHS